MIDIRQHLIDRHIDLSVHSVWIDQQDQSAAFPLWTLTGKMAGYQRYRPGAEKTLRNNPEDGRYYTYVSGNRCPAKAAQDVAFWGLESWHFTSDTLFVCEGIFDAARLTSRGVSAIALLKNDCDPSTRRYFDIVRGARRVIVVADESGTRFMRIGHRTHAVPQGDLGEAADEYIDGMLEEYT